MKEYFAVFKLDPSAPGLVAAPQTLNGECFWSVRTKSVQNAIKAIRGRYPVLWCKIFTPDDYYEKKKPLAEWRKHK